MKQTRPDPAFVNPVDLAPMRARQVLVLILAVLISALDGFDSLSMAFVAPAVAREWHLAKDLIGFLLASSLVGMAIGAIALSPLADSVGRKKVVLGALAVMTAGTALSGYAGSAPFLMLSRFVTGIGIGVMIAMTTLISAEFSNARRRSVAVAAVATVGFPLGGVFGGLVASAILKTVNWHWVFLSGSSFGIVLFVLVAVTLPETPAYLMTRRTPGALIAVNRVLAVLGHPAIARLPPEADRTRNAYRALFAPDMIGIVLRLMLTAILIATTAYYILNWLPQLVVDAGFTPAQGSFVSALAGSAGFVGGISFAAFAGRFAPNRVAASAMVAASLALAAVGLVPGTIAGLIASAGILSFCLAGTTGMLYAIMADAFPASARASGIGVVMGAARIMSAAGPALAGVMFKHGMSRADVSLLFAIGPLAGAVIIGTLRHHAPSPDLT